MSKRVRPVVAVVTNISYAYRPLHVPNVLCPIPQDPKSSIRLRHLKKGAQGNTEFHKNTECLAIMITPQYMIWVFVGICKQKYKKTNRRISGWMLDIQFKSVK